MNRRTGRMVGLIAALLGLLSLLAISAPAQGDSDPNWNDTEFASAGVQAGTLSAAPVRNTANFASGCNAVTGSPTEFDFSPPSGLPADVTSYQVAVAFSPGSATFTDNSTFSDTLSNGKHTILGSPFTVTPDANGNADWMISINDTNIGLLQSAVFDFTGTVSVTPVIGNWVGSTQLVGNWEIELTLTLGIESVTAVTCSWQ